MKKLLFGALLVTLIAATPARVVRCSIVAEPSISMPGTWNISPA